MGTFESGHVMSCLIDKLYKHSKQLKNALHHANPFQMLQSKKKKKKNFFSVQKLG